MVAAQAGCGRLFDSDQLGIGRGSNPYRTSIDVVLYTFAERSLAQAFGKGDKAKLGADALTGVRHFGGRRGLRRSLLKLAHVRQPLPQGMLEFFHQQVLSFVKSPVSIACSAAGMTGP
jgi:hypothetical protein